MEDNYVLTYYVHTTLRCTHLLISKRSYLQSDNFPLKNNRNKISAWFFSIFCLLQCTSPAISLTGSDQTWAETELHREYGRYYSCLIVQINLFPIPRVQMCLITCPHNPPSGNQRSSKQRSAARSERRSTRSHSSETETESMKSEWPGCQYVHEFMQEQNGSEGAEKTRLHYRLARRKQSGDVSFSPMAYDTCGEDVFVGKGAKCSSQGKVTQ